MKFRPEIEYQPCGPGKRYCCWTKGEGLNAKKSECKWYDGFCGWCSLFETHAFRDDRNRVLRCPQCVQAQKETET